MLLRTDIENKLKEIKPILVDQFHISEIGYFGSYANEQQKYNSDLDLIVEFSQPISCGFFATT